MKRSLSLVIALVLGLAYGVSAQCPGCPGEKSSETGKIVKKEATQEKKDCDKVCESGQCCQEETASAKLASLAKKAEGGCEASKAKLAAIKKELGTECCSEVGTKLAALEKNSAGGCKESSAKLASLKKIMDGAQDKKEAKKEEAKKEVKKEECGKECDTGSCCAEETASAKLATLAKNAEKGCEASKAKLAAIKKELGTECCDDASKKLAALEKNSAGGCKESAAKLASVKKMMDGDAKKEVKKEAKKEECGKECDTGSCCAEETVSGKLATLAKNAEGGCEASKAKIAAVKKELGTDCCSEVGTKLATLEKNAAGGCKESAAKLASLKKIMTGDAKKEEKKEEKKECKEGECPVQKP